jgi:hypothetical protein
MLFHSDFAPFLHGIAWRELRVRLQALDEMMFWRWMRQLSSM